MQPSYLRKRGRTYYLRIRIPADLCAGGQAEIWKSLHTTCHKTARPLALHLARAAELFFENARRGRVSLEDYKKILEQQAQMFYAMMDYGRRSDAYPSEEEMAAIWGKTAAEHRQALLRNDFDSCAEAVERDLRAAGIEVPPRDSEQWRMAARMHLQAWSQIYEAEVRRTRGEIVSDWDKITRPDVLTGFSFKPDEPPPAPVSAPEPKPDGPPLSEVIDLFLSDREHLAPKTRREYEKHKPFLLRILGDKPVDKYVRKDLLDARDVLKLWPRNANSTKGTEKLKVEEILARTDLGGPFAERTVLKYTTFLSTIFAYAVEADLIRRSPAPAPKKSKELQRDKGWQPWDAEDFERLLASRYYQHPTVRVDTPQNFWAPLIAMYSGLRLDEICQLYVADFLELEGVPCIFVNDGEDKKVKSRWSIRYVPIHPVLLELGLLDYVASVRHERIFPQLKKGPNGYSHEFGKNMQKHIRRNVTQEKKKVFHSLRDNFANAMKRAGFGEDYAGELIGHARKNPVTASYTGDYPPALLLKAVSAVDHGVDPLVLIPR